MLLLAHLLVAGLSFSPPSLQIKTASRAQLIFPGCHHAKRASRGRADSDLRLAPQLESRLNIRRRIMLRSNRQQTRLRVAAVLECGTQMVPQQKVKEKVVASVARTEEEGEEKEEGWHPNSWRSKPVQQQPTYEDREGLGRALETISSLPPLVQHWETRQLRKRLEEVFHGKRFVVQGGDCAEKFSDCNPTALESRVKVLEQMRIILERLPPVLAGKNKTIPVSVIRRAAGQYGKPRTNEFEVVRGVNIPVFKGDNVNSLVDTAAERKADPSRLLEGCLRAQCTMNYLRSRMGSGMLEYIDPETWRFREMDPRIVQYMRLALETERGNGPSAGSHEVYTSHEGLLLNLEQTLTKPLPQEILRGFVQSETPKSSIQFSKARHYNSGAHMLWIGTRTKHLNGAHTEYFRGIDNPVGIKVGMDTDPDFAVSLVRTVDPSNSPGKVVLISRFGAGDVKSGLPKLAQAVRDKGLNVIWFVDPMHGNTRKTSAGFKTRDFESVLSEIQDTHHILKEHGLRLGGIHLELTGEDVTECVGGSPVTPPLTDDDLALNWKSACDPRLNYQQSIELALQVANVLSKDLAGEQSLNM